MYQVGRSVDETLRLVQAFKYTEDHEEGVCECVSGRDNTWLPNGHYSNSPLPLTHSVPSWLDARRKNSELVLSPDPSILKSLLW